MNDTKKIAEKHVFANHGFAKYSETNVAETLRSGSGDTHGWGENLVVSVLSRQSDSMTLISPRHSEKQ